MTIEEINKKVCCLTELYNTCCPFEICEKKGISVVFMDLPGSIEGFFVNSQEYENKSYMSILINTSMPESEYERICAHELAHVVLHCNVNSEVCKDNPSICLEKLEIEAEIFSVLLLEKNNKKGT